MKQWGLVLGAVVALGATVAVVTVVSGRMRQQARTEEVPRLIEDCFDRIHQLESELRRLRPEALGSS